MALEYEARLLEHFDPAAIEDLKRVLRHLERAAELLLETRGSQQGAPATVEGDAG